LGFIGRTLGPFALLIGLGAGIYYLSKNLDRVEESLLNAAKGFRDFGKFVQDIANMVDWQQLGTDLVDGFIGAVSSLTGVGTGGEMSETARAIAEGFEALFDGISKIIGGLARGMWDRAVQWIMEPPDVESQVRRAGAAVGASIGVALSAAMISPLRGSIGSALMRAFTGIGRFLTGGGGRLGGGLLKTVLRRIPVIGGVIGVLFDLPEIISSFKTDGIVAGFKTLFGSIVNGLLLGIPEILGRLLGVDITGGIFDFLMNIPEKIAEFAGTSGLSEGISNFFEGGLEGALSFLETWGGILKGLFEQISGYVTPLIDEWGGTFSEIGEILSGLWTGTLQPLFQDIFGAIAGVEFGNLGDMFGSAEEGSRGFGETLRGFIDWLMPKIQWLSQQIMPLVVNAFDAWAGHVRFLVDLARNVLWPIFKLVLENTYNHIMRLVPVFEVVWEVIKFGVNMTWNHFKRVIGIIKFLGGIVFWLWKNVISPVFKFVYKLFKKVFIGAIKGEGIGVFEAIGDIVDWLWSSVIEPVFEWVKSKWDWVSDNIVSGVREAFGFVQTWITGKIEAAAEAFAILTALKEASFISDWERAAV